MRTPAALAALSSRNYRKYALGQAVSLTGTWMQSVVLSWLVLQLTRSGTLLGAVTACQFMPVLLLAPYGGLVADRMSKRRLLVCTQAVSGLIAGTLGALVVAGVITVWEIAVLAACLGVTNAFDQPGRQSFVIEMVGPEQLRNAVGLNSVITNAARAVGPAIGGLLLAEVGAGPSFLINAASYVAVIWALLTMNPAKLMEQRPASRRQGQLREGFRQVRRNRDIGVPLVMVALVGTLAYEFPVVLPLAAQLTFHADARGYGFMTASMGAGAVIGGLATAARRRTGIRPTMAAAVCFGIAMAAAAAAPVLWVEYIVLAVIGACSTTFLAVSQSSLQLAASPEMRGRVMALWAIAYNGSTPLGGPIIGAVSSGISPRAGFLAGALGCCAAGAIGLIALKRVRQPNGGLAPGHAPGPEAADPYPAPAATAADVCTVAAGAATAKATKAPAATEDSAAATAADVCTVAADAATAKATKAAAVTDPAAGAATAKATEAAAATEDPAADPATTRSGRQRDGQKGQVSRNSPL